MIPSTVASLVTLDYFCTDAEALSALATISNGSPLPLNVLDSIDPFHFQPKSLPDDVWYYVKCNGNVDSYLSSGFWKPKGGDCKLALDFPFTGLRTTYEFYEGQAPNEQKTAWVMLRYWMSRSDLCGNSKEKETSSLCKVFLGDEQFKNHQMIQKIKSSVVPNSEPICPNHQLVGLGPDGLNNTANGSTSKSKMSEDEILSDFLSRGDYIQLLDLDNPISPSSSSENSSCPSMSSDEYFDSDALLRELEHDNNLDMVPRDAPCIRSCAPSRLRKEVVHQEASESLVSIKRSPSLAEENLKSDSAVPGSGYSESELKGEASSSSHSKMVSNGEETAVDGGKKKKKKSVGKMKKIQRKYFCFFFYF